MSIVMVGSTSGSITLQEPAVAGNTVLDLPNTSGTILTTGSSGQSIPKAALPTGSVLQVVQGTSTTETTTTNGTSSPVDTTLSATITPTSSSSKILVIAVHGDSSCASASAGIQLSLVRGSTTLVTKGSYSAGFGSVNAGVPISISYLDSPSSTSALTYKTQFCNGQSTGTTVRINWGAAFSSITLMEIAA